MRIALITFGFVEHSAHLCKALSEHNKVLLCIPRQGERGQYERMLKEFLEDSIKVFYCEKYPTKSYQNISMVTKLRRTLRDFDPDVLFIQGQDLWLLLMVQLFFKNLPLVLDMHDPRLHSGKGSTAYPRFTYWTQKRLANFASRIIVHGEALVQDMSVIYAIEEENIVVMRRGEYSITKVYDDPSVKPIPNRILFFGRIARYKGIETLIKAQPKISEEIPDATIHIVGREQYTGYLSHIRDASRFIIHNSPIDWEEVPKVFREADVVVLPYWDATQSGVLSTALAYRKPVVVTSVGALPEMVEDGKTGFIVPPHDINALAGVIIRILKDKDLKKKIAENIDTKLQGELSWRELVKPVQETLDQIHIE